MTPALSLSDWGEIEYRVTGIHREYFASIDADHVLEPWHVSRSAGEGYSTRIGKIQLRPPIVAIFCGVEGPMT
jgi:hypothetical protein